MNASQSPSKWASIRPMNAGYARVASLALLVLAVVGSTGAFFGPLATGDYSDVLHEIRLATYPVIFVSIAVSTTCFAAYAISLVIRRRSTLLLYGFSALCFSLSTIGLFGAWVSCEFGSPAADYPQAQPAWFLLITSQVLGVLGVLLWYRAWLAETG